MLRGMVLCYALFAFTTSAEVPLRSRVDVPLRGRVDVPLRGRVDVPLRGRVDVPLRGRVMDEQSRPIAGARIGLFTAFLPDANRAAIATAADDGTFTFLAHPQQKHLLWIEADGFAPRLLDGIVAHAPAAIETIRLVRGASLSVSIDDAQTHANARLQLVPRRVELGDNVTPELVRAIWTRAVARRVEWPSLPPGEYELWLRDSNDLPRSLLTLTLARNDVRHEQVTLTALTVPAEKRPLTIVIEGEPRLDLARATVWRWIGNERHDVPSEQKRVTGRELTLYGGCVEGASFTIVTPEAFAVTPVVGDSCRGTLRVDAFARADATVRLTSKGATPPKAGAIVVRWCGASEKPARPLPDLRFAVDDEGRAEFLLPAGCTTPLLSTGRFAPIELGTVRSTAKQRHDFGTRELTEGASLLVRVISRDDGMPLANATILAFAPAALQQARADEISVNAAKARAVTSAEGWARITVPAEEIVLGVLRGSSRLPWLSEKYRGESGRELVIDAVEVPRPGSLTVRTEIAPALAEAGVRIVRVVLQPAPEQRWPPRALFEAAPRDGVALFDEVPAGKWLAFAMFRMLDDPPMPSDRVAVEVLDGFPTETSLPIKGLLFRGRIIAGGERLQREIFVRPHDRALQPVSTMLDGEDRFTVLLEKPGLHAVFVRIDGQETSAPRVRFDDPEREVEVRLPNGGIAGRVTSHDGAAVAGAAVRATLLDAADGKQPAEIVVTARTGGDGSFRFSRMSGGTWTLQARARTAESQRLSIDLAAEETVGDVVLRVEETTKVGLRVVSANGAPAAGAKVTIGTPPARRGDYGTADMLLTDAEGRAAFRASPEHRGGTLRFSVVAADGTAAAFRRPVEDVVTLVLPPVTGQLVVTMAEGEWPPTSAELWLVNNDGAILGLRAGRVVTGDDGRRSRFVVPRIAPDVWRLVTTNTIDERHQMLIGNGAALPALGVAHVPPGGTGEMTLRSNGKGER